MADFVQKWPTGREQQPSYFSHSLPEIAFCIFLPYLSWKELGQGKKVSVRFARRAIFGAPCFKQNTTIDAVRVACKLN